VKIDNGCSYSTTRTWYIFYDASTGRSDRMLMSIVPVQFRAKTRARCSLLTGDRRTLLCLGNRNTGAQHRLAGTSICQTNIPMLRAQIALTMATITSHNTAIATKAMKVLTTDKLRCQSLTHCHDHKNTTIVSSSPIVACCESFHEK